LRFIWKAVAKIEETVASKVTVSQTIPKDKTIAKVFYKVIVSTALKTTTGGTTY